MLPPSKLPVYIGNIQGDQTAAQDKGKPIFLCKIPGILSAYPRLTKLSEDLPMKHLTAWWVPNLSTYSSEKMSMRIRELRYKKLTIYKK